MKSTYVADKDLSDQSAFWTVKFGKKHHVEVFVWKSQEGLFRNTGFTEKDTTGAYIGVPGERRSGLFGEIHLLRDMIGPGYVAHELQHLIFDWLCERDMKEFKSGLCLNERMAYLMSDVTTDFWEKFYEFYDVVPSANNKIVPDDR
jgi:hypothetical protein